LDSFRYPLSGEFAMAANLARVNRIPADWGLEVGVLAEVFRNCAVSRICQVDVADTYEHKHQALSQDDPSKGLARMAADIAKSLFVTLAAEGIVFTADHFRSLEVRYVRMAQDTIARYYADAMLNGLKFDRNGEELAVATFAESLKKAAGEFVVEPRGLPLIPNWNRVLAAIPEFFEVLTDAVEKDAKEH
jgi:glucosyl-3-phosphoglycerate synthase